MINMNIKAKLKKIGIILLKALPVKHCVLFNSFDGLYNDNPKYVSVMLHSLYPDVKIFWVVGEDSHEAIPDYVHKVPAKGFYRDVIESTSAVVVDNFSGIRRMEKNVPSKWVEVYTKDSRRINISTWHGTPLKKIGFDIPGIKNSKYYYTSSKYMISGCSYVKNCFSTAFPGVEVRMYGTPRNDCLVGKTGEANSNELKKKLRLPLNKKVVLYAPTFRESTYESGVHQLEQLNIRDLLSALNERFGGEWVFVYRVHHEVFGKVNFECLTDDIKECIYPGNIGDDMAEYLQVTDALITDYSGSMYDFALTGRPCWLFALDRSHYEQVERGFYMSLSELPFLFLEKPADLYDAIRGFDSAEYKKKVGKFLTKIGNIEDGQASRRLVDDIIKYMN